MLLDGLSKYYVSSRALITLRKLDVGENRQS